MRAPQRRVVRALARLAQGDNVLSPARAGVGYGVFPQQDRRRKPLAQLSAAEVRTLAAEGAIAATGTECFILTAAGRARVRREADAREPFQAQHGPVVERTVMTPEGAPVKVRGYDSGGILRRLAALRNADGAPFLSVEELRAATRLRDDWACGQAGLVRGSDWSAPPRSGAARGSSSALEAASGARVDARRRVEAALGALAPPLRRVVEQACLHELGLEAIERAEAWPARSAKIALKLGLAQIAAHEAAARACA